MTDATWPESQYPNPQPRSRRFFILKTIGIILLVMVLICGGLLTYVAFNVRKLIASVAQTTIVPMVQQSQLPDEQKADIEDRINRVASAYQDGKISHTQMTQVLDRLMKGPFVGMIVVEKIRHQYRLLSSPTDEARQQTMLLLDRLQRGLAEEKISLNKFQDIIASLGTMSEDGKKQNFNNLEKLKTEADFKPFLEAARQAVDEAKIPAEPYQPDFAAIIDKVTQPVLGSIHTGSNGESKPAPEPSMPTKKPATEPAELPTP